MRKCLVVICLSCIASWTARTHADEPPPQDPTSPHAQLDALLQEYRAAQQAYGKAMFAAKTSEERRQVVEQKFPQPSQYFARFLELANVNTQNEVGFKALSWVVNNGRGDPQTKPALASLAKHHAEHPQIGPLCRMSAGNPWREAEELFRAVATKNKYHEAQGHALHALANSIKDQRDHAHIVRDPAMEHLVGIYKRFYGEDYVARVAQLNLDKTGQEAEALFETIIRDYHDMTFSGRSLADIAKGDLFEMRNLAVGKAAPEIKGKDLLDVEFKLSDYHGKVVLLDFWGHWCAPCRTMYPYEQTLVERLKDKPFALLGINSDRRKQELKTALEREMITWRSWFDGGGTDGPIAKDWNIQGWPTRYVVDHQGIIRKRFVTWPGGDVIDHVIDALVAEAELAAATK